MDTKSKPQSRIKKVQGLKTQYVKGQGHSFVVLFELMDVEGFLILLKISI